MRGWKVGDRVMALLGGGGHAERVAVPAGQLLRVPESLSWAEAAAVPEAALTAWTNLVAEGGLAAGETVLIPGASGGVGSFAVQLAHQLGATVVAAGRDLERLEPLRALGADHLLRDDDELPEHLREAAGRGADLVFDPVSGERLPSHLAALSQGGRLVLVGLMAGARANIDLALVLRRRLRVIGSVLRSRAARREGPAGGRVRRVRVRAPGRRPAAPVGRPELPLRADRRGLRRDGGRRSLQIVVETAAR